MAQWPVLKNRTPSNGPAAGIPGYRSMEHELVIGNSLRFRGDLDVNADLRIEGTVKGCISAGCHTVIIEQDGLAEANVHAGTVIIHGQVRGAIVARDSVTLASTARVVGPIHAARVILEDGCVLAGRIDVATAPVKDLALP